MFGVKLKRIVVAGVFSKKSREMKGDFEQWDCRQVIGETNGNWIYLIYERNKETVIQMISGRRYQLEDLITQKGIKKAKMVLSKSLCK